MRENYLQYSADENSPRETSQEGNKGASCHAACGLLFTWFIYFLQCWRWKPGLLPSGQVLCFWATSQALLRCFEAVVHKRYPVSSKGPCSSRDTEMYTNPAISSLGILVLQIGRQSLLDSLSYRAQEQKDTRASELVSLVLAQVPLLTKVQRTDILQSCICI